MKSCTHTNIIASLVSSVILVACSAFAGGAADTLVSFSTTGEEPDRYADGEVVMDGECYALVWSKDGVFDGLKANGEPIDENDAVVLVAALAKNGHCQEVVFQIDSELASQYASGKYDVLLLDTRVNKGGVVAPRGMAGGSLSVVNGYGSVTDNTSMAATSHTSIAAMLEGGIVAGESAGTVEGVQQPRIKHIKIVGDNVLLTVENLGGFLHVHGGENPNSIVTLGAATEVEGETDEVVLVVPKVGTSGFYSVKRN